MSNEISDHVDLPDSEIEGIKEEYLKTIKLPSGKSGKQFLLCPVGYIGAGKTTVTKLLADKLGLVRVSHDDLRQILKREGYNYNRSKEIAKGIVDMFLSKGYGVALDANCGSGESRKHIEDTSERYAIKTIWVLVDPPEEFIITKLKNYKHTWLFENGDKAVSAYKRYKEEIGDIHELGIDYVYKFDTSRDNLEDQINEAASVIESSL